MESIVKLYSDKPGEISSFLNKFFTTSEFKISDELLWENHYKNPTEIADIIGTFIENNDKYKINMWISLDKDFFININDYNADKIIRYLYERYPW
ncbi:MAG TPA: hypothetical protein OIM50_01845 [Clostridiaceae bacterium]|nr:hypothetical protein [Clostridia bacterium]HCF65557.1 hypothetical protein [Clostridiales bacterium]HJJ09035.1 hypothetical protein [Clostridiaceae bacterium]